MGRNDSPVYVANVIYQIGNFFAVLVGQTIACSIGNIHYRCTCLNNRLYHTRQIFVIGTARILAVKFHFIYKIACVCNRFYGTAQNVFLVGIKLVFYVILRRANTGMNTLAFGIFQSLYRHINIGFDATGKRTNNGRGNCFGNFYHRIKITRTRNRESCFYYIHAKGFKGFCHLNFLYGVKLTTRHLLAIAKGCVEDV